MPLSAATTHRHRPAGVILSTGLPMMTTYEFQPSQGRRGRIVTGLALLFSFLLTACTPSTPAGAPQGGPTPTTSNDGEAKTPVPAPPLSPSPPKAPGEISDETPLEAYVDVKTFPEDFLTWLLVSHLPNPPSDEDKLNLFAPGYFNQADVFKKKDIAGTALPGINARLGEVANMSHFIIDVPVLGTHIQPYDVETRSFLMENCGPGQTATYADQHRTQLVVTIPTSLCQITVADEAKARDIEGYRAAFHIDVREKAWIRVDGVDPLTNTVKATATHLHFVFVRSTMDDQRRYVAHKTPAPVLLDVQQP